MSDTPTDNKAILNVDPRVVHRTIALKLRELANAFDQLGDGTITRELSPNAISKEQVDAAKPGKGKKAEEKKAEEKKAEEKKAEEKKADAAPAAPEKVAADLKLKLTTLVNKNRAEAIRILGTVGAKKFSEIPVEKHAAVLAEVEKSLAPAKEDDPLS